MQRDAVASPGESPDTRDKIVEKVEAESEGGEISEYEGSHLLTSYPHVRPQLQLHARSDLLSIPLPRTMAQTEALSIRSTPPRSSAAILSR